MGLVEEGGGGGRVEEGLVLGVVRRWRGLGKTEPGGLSLLPGRMDFLPGGGDVVEEGG